MVSNLQHYLLKVRQVSNLIPRYYRNLVTFSSTQSFLLSIIKQTKRVNDLKPIWSLIIINGLTDYKHVVSEFIGRCFDLGVPELALSSFYSSRNRSLLLQNLIIRRLCNLGLYQDVIFVYKTCRVSGCSSGDYTFPYVIRACSALCDVELGRVVHGVVFRTGFDDNVVVQTAFVDFYAKVGRMDVARSVFDEMPEWDVVSWNALISGYSLNGDDYEAVDVFHENWVEGVRPNVSTLASIVPVCTRSGFLDLGRCLHGFAVKCGLDQDELVAPALISMYSSNGDVCTARCLFMSFSDSQNLSIWNSMIYAHTQNQQPQQALELFQQMVRTELQPNIVTFVSVIPCSEKTNSISHGQSLHGYVIRYGLDNQVSVVTALISMYAKLGDIDSADYLFAEMPQKNLLTWNSLISGYVHHGLLHTSLEAVREMQLAGFTLDSISINNVISACSKLEMLMLGKSVHAVSVRKAFDFNINVSNRLLALYSDCGQLHSSFKLFDKMNQKNFISWNTMISGCIHHGETEKAMMLVRGMQQEGELLDVVTLIIVLRGYNESNDLVQGMAIHGFAIKCGFISDVTLANSLISMYSSCCDLNAATLLFNTMTERCLVSWNSLATGYRCHALHKEVIVLFKQMMGNDEIPNYITLLNVLPGCQTLLQVKSIHSYAIRTGAVRQTPLVTSLMSMYSRFNHMSSCLSLFESVEKRDISLWNAMMSVLLEAREAVRAFTLFKELILKREPQVDYVAILSLISACFQLNSLYGTNSVFAFVIKHGFLGNTTICNALIDLYAKCGAVSMAREVFEGIPKKDSLSWSVMINGYGLHGDGEAAISLLSEMQRSGAKPGSITYLSVLSACSHSGLVEQSKIMFNSMLEHGIQPTMEHYGCVLDLLGRTGKLDEAYEIVSRLPGGPSVSMLESLLGACRVHGNVELGKRLSELLIERDPRNSGGYVMLHNIYAASGRWQEANSIRSVMEEKELRKLPGFSVF